MPDSFFPLPSSLLRRRSLLATALALPLLGHAQAWPARPIVMIVPQAPGGTNDIVGRLVSQKLAEVLGASVVVENRPGAGGSVAASAILQSPADGYTLLVTDGPMLSITPLINKKITYDAANDFVPIALVGASRAMPRGKNWPVPGRQPVTVVIGEPMSATAGETGTDFSARIHRTVSDMHRAHSPEPDASAPDTKVE